MRRPLALPCDGERLAQIAAGPEDEIEQVLDQSAVFRAKALAAQADHIQAGHAVDPLGGAVMRDVLAETAVALNDAVIANAKELVEDGAAANEGVVAHVHMTGQQDGVGHHVAVSQLHIMREVRIGHDEVVVSQAGGAARLGTTMNGDLLSNDVVLADEGLARRGRIERKVLRRLADDGGATDPGSLADRGVANDLGVCADNHARGDFHRPFNDDIGADAGSWVDLGAGIDDGGGMDHGKVY